MTRVGIARTKHAYGDLVAPFGPGRSYPELAAWLPPDAGPPNHVYAAVRAALHALGLDSARFGRPDWNPLGDLVRPGARVVCKPNFIRHWNPAPGASIESVVTHGSVLRAALDYARLAVGPEGSLAIAEAPQHDCDFEAIRRIAGLDAIADFYAKELGCGLEIVDLRREAVVYRDGVIVERRSLPGDPRGYRLVDLGSRSAFHGSGLDPQRFRGADYDARPTSEHHLGGRHEYLLSETVLCADLVLNLPKLKTHKKTGVTLALKNLVGINGDKNLLPHHCAGSSRTGGDEFPGEAWIDRARSRAIDAARLLLRRGRASGILRAARRIENAARGDTFVRAGNWHGNRTTWRMCLDLNRAFYYSDAGGQRWEAPAPVRRALHIVDGIVAGEGDGPLAPRDRPLGVIVAAADPLALELACVRLMGFDEERIPLLREAMADSRLRIGEVRSASDVQVMAADTEGRVCETSLTALAPARAFSPHPGWRGRMEVSACAE